MLSTVPAGAGADCGTGPVLQDEIRVMVASARLVVMAVRIGFIFITNARKTAIEARVNF